MNSYERLMYADSYMENDPKPGLWLPLLYIWLMALVSFSRPERADTESLMAMDMIAVAKLGIRATGLFLFGIALARIWRTDDRRIVTWCLWPFLLYVGWAILSTVWSPLKAFSLGQAGGLLLQLMMATLIALRCSDLRETSTILFHLVLALLSYDAMVLLVHLVAPDASGLNREILVDIGGFVHPTSVGAAASLGMVMLITARLLWDWRWIRVLLAPGLVLSGLLLYLSESRTALGVTFITLIISFSMFSRRIVLAVASLLFCCLAILYLTADPGLDVVDNAMYSAGSHIRRGQSPEEMSSFTGRTVLWKHLWGNFVDQPLNGYGYMVGSKDGVIDIWGGATNKTAHNIFMQVLVSTGLIGMVLCIWAFIRLTRVWLKVFPRDAVFQNQASFLLILGIWYFGWGMLCTSWFGPVRPESVVFYSLLGIALSRMPHNA